MLMPSPLPNPARSPAQFRFPTLLPGGAPEAAPTGLGKKLGASADDAEKAARRRRDVRFDRAMLLLQTEVGRLGWQSALHGAWGGSLHLVVRIPGPGASCLQAAGGRVLPAGNRRFCNRPHADTAGGSSAHLDAAHGFLDEALSRVFRRAGLGAWAVPTGAPDPLVPLKIQRILGEGGVVAVAQAQQRTPLSASLLADGLAGRVRLFPASAGALGGDGGGG